MSAISSTTGSGLLQYLQGMAGTQSTSSSSATSGSSAAAAIAPKSGKHHHNGGFDKLLSAITSALQSASNSASSTSTDPNQTITEALAKIFKNGSVQSTGDSTSNPSAVNSTDTDNDTGPSSPQNFLQTLKSFGVTPQQFQSDLTAALQSAKESGSADLSSAFKNFPTGSIVDTVG